MGVNLLPTREQALANYYSAERRAGADPVPANIRMGEFAKRLDALDVQQTNEARQYEADLSVIRQCMGRVS